MELIYKNLASNIQQNSQSFAVFKYASRVNSATLFGIGNGLALLSMMAAGVKHIKLYHAQAVDISQFEKLAETYNINFEFTHSNLNGGEIKNTDLLYLDTVAEGNIVYSHMKHYNNSVNRYILVNHTYTHAHDPQPGIQLGDNIPCIGMIHGVNSFITEFPSWHILEHMYWEPGLTVLYNRKDIDDDGR